MISRISLAVATLAFPLSAFAVTGDGAFQTAQIYSRPSADAPADIEELEPPAAPRDSGLSTRVDRLERELRNMTGRMEELQHSVQLLEEQLRAAKQDSPHGVTPPPASGSGPGRRSDAFDPAGNPGAPGAPREIGQATPSAPLSSSSHPASSGPLREPGAPLDLTGHLAQPSPAIAAPVDGAPSQTTVKEDYEQAVALMRAGQYESAEKSLVAFLQKYPKSKYSPAATYGLGESFYQRARYREAAEKYLEISTKYGQSAQAPEAMLRLGQSLSALGAKEQACASFSEIGAKYPGSPNRIKDAAQKESKKLQC
ncbi:tol-pal system protein YbgF [Methylocystis heyeri]|uniref:Cell division coordinator CpoB n=1 Tax=Methylocystis heyeri TaxID=391905 RepID=A0A6B8KK07_9HYPH|nr:tol-pal system protein YbgF [Methylocystis heyeri]QGM46948.1 tol-pal system protein YbgF [Methylocystis heyeri]